MASIDGLFLGGSEVPSLEGRTYRAAVAYKLTKPSQISQLEEIDDWVVETSAASTTVVARTGSCLDRLDAIEIGTERIQQWLDIVSFERRIQMELLGIGETHVALYVHANKQILEMLTTTDFPITVSATVVSSDGLATRAQAPAFSWVPALRFYRLSQSSRNLYEAYRNLWLGLEVLLSSIQPKNQREGERAWLERVLRHVSTTVDLRPYLPRHITDVAAYLIDEQYVRIRCHLFHAKPDPTASVPRVPSPEATMIAYDQLIGIWRAIAVQIAGVRSGGGGVFTLVGFKQRMDSLFSLPLAMASTSDSTPAAASDISISPAGQALNEFDEASYLGEIASGIVAVSGTMNLSDRLELPPQFRIGLKAGDTLFGVDFVDGGIELSGVDLFKNVVAIRLLNQGIPRTRF